MAFSMAVFRHNHRESARENPDVPMIIAVTSHDPVHIPVSCKANPLLKKSVYVINGTI
jgi:hypothetical protein